MSISLGVIFSSFGAGFLASLSPCVYPILPITIGFLGSQANAGKKLRIFVYFIGQVLTFSALGVLAISLGRVLGFTSQSSWVQIVIGALLILFSSFLLFPKLGLFLSKLKFPFSSKGKSERGPLLSAFLFGVGSALLVCPCTTPILSGVLAMIASDASFFQGVVLMFFYSIGFSTVFLAFGLGIMNLNKFPKAGIWLNYIHKLAALLLIIAGIYYLYNGIYI